ncbi:hypothetical protein HHK36_024517 [Tetracentron sinense]|uniref:phosphoethanolamine N-methyltransferase n=1 Tax=Tetracentron sinense TaxID=13715 RepID=A0A834YKF6_TETSI|nr:hypothetical protein HHK36_024517 [Tetracentron sinense]
MAAQWKEREIQKSYWIEQSLDLTVEAMMLDSKASDLDKEERPEMDDVGYEDDAVLSLLPPYKGKSILELGAGIGRFTGELAKEAGQLLAMDFIESAIKKNESSNGHFKNVNFMCADVMSPDLKISYESVDLIFSNWLLMYLSDKEVFKECHMRDDAGNSFEFSLISCKCIGAYICWVWQKVKSQDDGGFQQFLDNVQYKCSGILRYERVFGEGFVSTGGIDTTKEFVSKLDLKPGQRVLDVGCGIGGGDFYMAENFDVEVIGIDLSVNMVSFALERAIGRKCSVEFEVADCTKKTYPDNTFDVIYSRDTILHIQDKPALFRTFFKWLKPGGRVLISDYCKRAGLPSAEFGEYIKQRGYDLHDVEVYGQMLKDAGFGEVIAEDRTDQFLKVLQRELEVLEKDKASFICDFSEEDYNEIIGGWKAKMIRSSSGEQRAQRSPLLIFFSSLFFFFTTMASSAPAITNSEQPSSEQLVTPSSPAIPDSAQPSSLPSHHPHIINISQFVSVKLDGLNYLLWKNQIQPILILQDLFGFVDGSLPSPLLFLENGLPNPAFLSWKRSDNYVMSCINATLTEGILAQTVGLNSSRAIWDLLASTFLQQSAISCSNDAPSPTAANSSQRRHSYG